MQPVDMLTLVLIVGALVLLGAIISTYFIATQQKLSEYKTPIPLTKPSYARGEVVSGYFTGRKIYGGNVTIVRQLSCSDGYLDSLPNLKNGEPTVQSIAPARDISGNLPRDIARVPAEVSSGASCVVLFDHSACVPYLFGCFEQHYSYVSQPFIVSTPSSDDSSQDATPNMSAPTQVESAAPAPASPALNNGNASATVAEQAQPIEDGNTEITTLQTVLGGLNTGVSQVTDNVTGLVRRIVGAKQ